MKINVTFVPEKTYRRSIRLISTRIERVGLSTQTHFQTNSTEPDVELFMNLTHKFGSSHEKFDVWSLDNPSSAYLAKILFAG